MSVPTPRTRAIEQLQTAIYLIEDARADLMPRPRRGRSSAAERRLRSLVSSLRALMADPAAPNACADVRRVRFEVGAVRRDAPGQAVDSLHAAHTSLLCPAGALDQLRRYGT